MIGAKRKSQLPWQRGSRQNVFVPLWLRLQFPIDFVAWCFCACETNERPNGCVCAPVSLCVGVAVGVYVGQGQVRNCMDSQKFLELERKQKNSVPLVPTFLYIYWWRNKKKNKISSWVASKSQSQSLARGGVASWGVATCGKGRGKVNALFTLQCPGSTCREPWTYTYIIIYTPRYTWIHLPRYTPTGAYVVSLSGSAHAESLNV